MLRELRRRIWFLALLAPIGFASALSLALLPVWSVFAVIGLLLASALVMWAAPQPG